MLREFADTLRIAPLANADTEAVVALWRRCGLTRPWNDPHADVALAVGTTGAEVLVGHAGEAVAATAMVGFDGHRGWVYYLAVDPDARLGGFGRAMMTAAEAWLRERGAPKINLMVRDDNAAAGVFYERLGYEIQAVRTFGKFL